MRKYTALYTPKKSKEAILQKYEAYVSLRISNKILTITELPKTVQFVKDICVSINKLSSLCQKEAELNNEPCRWL